MEGQNWGVPEFSLAVRKEKVGKGIGSDGIVSVQQRSLRGVRPWKVELAESAKSSALHLEAMTGPPTQSQGPCLPLSEAYRVRHQ